MICMLKIIQKQSQQQQTSLSKRIKLTLSHGIVCILVAAFISCAHTYPVFAASTSHVQNVYGGSSIQEAYARKEIVTKIISELNPNLHINIIPKIIKYIIIFTVIVMLITSIIKISINRIHRNSISMLTIGIIITVLTTLTTGILNNRTLFLPGKTPLLSTEDLLYDFTIPVIIEPEDISNKNKEYANVDEYEKSLRKQIENVIQYKKREINKQLCKESLPIVSGIVLFILLIAKIIANLRSSIKTFQKAMGLDDTKILRPAKLGFWLTVIGTPCIIFFYIPIWLPLLIIGYVFTKQAKNMLDADKQPVDDNAYDQADALERLRMRQGQG